MPFFYRCIKSLILPAAIQVACLSLIYNFYQPTNIFLLLCMNLIAACGYCLFFWNFSIHLNERTLLLQKVGIKR